MIECTAADLDRLYALYCDYYVELRRGVAEANRILGSKDPTRTRHVRLTREEFSTVLTNPAADAEVLQVWLERIVRGHESSIPALKLAG